MKSQSLLQLQRSRCSIRFSFSAEGEEKAWFGVFNCAVQAELINMSSSKIHFDKGCWETKIQGIRKDEWLLSWLTRNSVYQQRKYFLCAWCWLHFPVWNYCQESCFNSEIPVDGWDCLKDSRHGVSHPVCKFEKHLRVLPSCWKTVSWIKPVESTALVLTFSHMARECSVQFSFFPLHPTAFFFLAKRNVMCAGISFSECHVLYSSIYKYICSSVQQILFIS